MLHAIEESLRHFAHVIAVVVGIDVEVVDGNLVRIAGTGRYAPEEGESIADEGEVYRYALKTGKPVYIDDPKQHPICRNCRSRDTCEEKLTLCAPVLVDEQAVGVIGIICFTEADKHTIQKNRETYEAFLTMVSALIGIQARERHRFAETERVLAVLRQVVDIHASGVFVFAADGNVTYINDSARKELELSDKDHVQVQLIPTGNTLADAEEYELHAAGRHLTILGKMVELASDDPRFARVMVFESRSVFTRKMSDFTTSPGTGEGLAAIRGASPAIVRLKQQVQAIASSSSTVLITGASGTGKELFARAIHQESDRKGHPFVPINCGAIPDNLLESELFGYTSGAFTGASPKGRIGKFELAHHGVIFLDEISSMPLYLQVKLLRVLQERKVTRLGANRPIDIDIRVIAATNDDLPELIAKNMFRSDLFYRLNVIPMEIPPLRERIVDIDLLAGHFLETYSRRFNKRFTKIDPATLAQLQAYPWPGNIREFENTIEFMVNMMPANGRITSDLLPPKFRTQTPRPPMETAPALRPLVPLKELEKQAISDALARFGSDTRGKRTAAKQLGIGLATLYRKCNTYGLG